MLDNSRREITCEVCRRFQRALTAMQATRMEQRTMANQPLDNRPGSGVLFRQRDVDGKRPHWRGGVNIDGVEYELAAWIRQSKRGVEFLSLAIKPVRAPESNDPF